MSVRSIRSLRHSEDKEQGQIACDVTNGSSISQRQGFLWKTYIPLAQAGPVVHSCLLAAGAVQAGSRPPSASRAPYLPAPPPPRWALLGMSKQNETQRGILCLCRINICSPTHLPSFSPSSVSEKPLSLDQPS